MAVFFDENDVPAALGEKSGDGRSAGTAADHQDITSFFAFAL
jgi:hypothetical protein